MRRHTEVIGKHSAHTYVMWRDGADRRLNHVDTSQHLPAAKEPGRALRPSANLSSLARWRRRRRRLLSRLDFILILFQMIPPSLVMGGCWDSDPTSALHGFMFLCFFFICRLIFFFFLIYLFFFFFWTFIKMLRVCKHSVLYFKQQQVIFAPTCTLTVHIMLTEFAKR